MDDVIKGYLQSRLSPNQARAFEARMAEDADLRAEVATLRAAQQTFLKPPRDLPPNG